MLTTHTENTTKPVTPTASILVVRAKLDMAQILSGSPGQVPLPATQAGQALSSRALAVAMVAWMLGTQP